VSLTSTTTHHRRRATTRAVAAAVAGALALACGSDPAPKRSVVVAVALPSQRPAAARRAPPTGRATLIVASDRASRGSELSFSPDGSLIAAEKAPHTIAVFDSESGAERAVVATPGDVLAIGWRADGGAFWAQCAAGAASWDRLGGPIFAVATPGASGAAWSPSGERLAIIDAGGALRVLAGRGGGVLWKASAAPGSRIEAWSIASDVLVTIESGARQLWDGELGAPLGGAPAPPAGWTATLSPDARTLLLESDDHNRFRFVDPRTGSLRAEHQLAGNAAYQSAMTMTQVQPGWGDPAQILQTSWSPDGSAVAIAHDPPNSIFGMYTRDMDVAIYDGATGARRPAPKGQLQYMGLAGWSRDGTRLHGHASSGAKAWDTSTGAAVGDPFPDALATSAQPDPTWTFVVDRELDPAPVRRIGHREPLWTIPLETCGAYRCNREPESGKIHAARCDDGRRVLLTSPDHPGRIVELTPEEGRARAVDVKLSDLSALACAGEQWIAVSSTYPHTTATVRAGARAELGARFASDDHAPALSPDGKLFAFENGGRLVIAGAAAGHTIHSIDANPIGPVGWSPNGERLVANTYPSVRIFDRGGTEVGVVGEGLAGWSFTPDGDLILALGHPGELRRVDPTTGTTEETHTLPELAVPEHALVFSRDAAVLSDGRIVVRVADGKTVAELPQKLADPVFSPDGSLLAGTALGEAAIYGARDGRVETTLALRDGERLLGWSGDGRHVYLHARAGVRTVRIADGAYLRADLVPGSKGVVWSLDSGHFDGDRRALRDVRIFLPGAAGEPFMFEAGATWSAFRRTDVHLDRFAPPYL
jgi:WD40 repeat protein